MGRCSGMSLDEFIGWAVDLYSAHVPPGRLAQVRVGLVVALIIIFAGVVIDSLFSASWALDDGLLLAAAVIALALLVTRGSRQA
jgi:hypothetical protein